MPPPPTNGRYGTATTPLPAMRPRRVLVVDDEPTILKLVKTFLGVDGYEVLLADGGEAGLEMLRTQEVDLVILDVRMPGMNGIEVCRRIRADPANARLPVVFLTADGDNELAFFQGLEVGGDEYLHKPIHRRELSARVKNLLRLADVDCERQLLKAAAQNEKLAAVGQMAAGVAHEINNPMAFVLSNLTCLRNYFVEVRAVFEAYGRSPSEGAAAARGADLERVFADAGPLLDETFEGCKRIRAISRELKTFSREDTERLEPVDLSDVARSTLLLTERELGQSASLVKTLEPAPVAQGSRARLQQVVLNLLVNARYAVDSRPPSDGARHSIHVSTRVDGNQAVLEVADTGCGIAPEHLVRLFQPFFTTKPAGIGTGLGLSVCATIVQRMCGHIDVESAMGVGTTFKVVLPCQTEVASPAGRRTTAAGKLPVVPVRPSPRAPWAPWAPWAPRGGGSRRPPTRPGRWA